MSRIKNVIKSKGGFTLIELLIVVVIIGILAAIVVPNIAGLLGTADLSAARADLNTLRTEVTAYRATSDDRDYPSGTGEIDNWQEYTDNWTDTGIGYAADGSYWEEADDPSWSAEIRVDFGDEDVVAVQISDLGTNDVE